MADLSTSAPIERDQAKCHAELFTTLCLDTLHNLAVQHVVTIPIPCLGS